MNTSATLFSPSTAPSPVAPQATPGAAPLGSTGGTGAISGGLLRPGSIDQSTFVQMLQQQQQNRQAAGVGGKPVQAPIQNFQNAIPTLTSAQFAALVGAQAEAEPSETPDPLAAAAPVPIKLSGALPRSADTRAAAGKPAAGTESADTPTIVRAAKQTQAAAMETAAADAESGDAPEIHRATETKQTAATAPADANSETEPETKATSKADPNVVHLKSPPDKDQQIALRAQHKRWVVDETPGARRLFFGADGVFGWDDFLDVINPLQHIPIISQIYRAATGDEIDGAASLLGAIPFGPLGSVGMIGAIADLAVKDVTGKDIGDNLQAMIFGTGDEPDGDTPGKTPADMAAVDGEGTVTVQTAANPSGYAVTEASQLHESCRG